LKGRVDVKKPNGFTLIELMIVVAVIAALAVIAIPNYLSQTRKARRSDVEGSMQQVALAQERFRADCTTYATAFSFACPGGTPPTFSPVTTFYTSGYYTVAITAANTGATTYEITAAPIGNQAKDSASGTTCGTLKYDFGVTTSGTVTKTPAACWSK